MKTRNGRGLVKVASAVMKIEEKRLQWYEHSKGREEWQMHRYQERDGEEDRKPGGKTHVIEILKAWG